MDWVQVHSQQEADAAIAAGHYNIEAAAGVALKITAAENIAIALKSVTGAVFNLDGLGRFHLYDGSRVEARGSSRPHVVAWGSSQPHVEAWESSQPHVEARESSQPHVEARGYVQLSVFGKVVAKLSAGCHAVVRGAGAEISGGKKIVVRIRDAREWCDYYGAKIFGANALVYKGLGGMFVSSHGATYTPGTETVAPDWDGGERECGKGLHFSPHPAMTREFAPDAKKFVACLVPLKDIAVHENGVYPQKIKAPRCWNFYECDIHGERIGEKFPKPQTRAATKRTAKKAVKK